MRGRGGARHMSVTGVCHKVVSALDAIVDTRVIAQANSAARSDDQRLAPTTCLCLCCSDDSPPSASGARHRRERTNGKGLRPLGADLTRILLNQAALDVD